MKQLSYSSATLLSNCEQKYVHRKVLETKVDPDYEASTAFAVGSAFHKVLEDTMHTRLSIKENTEAACKEYKVNEVGLVEGMVHSYLDMHELSELECVFCEFEINDPMVIGYIDVVMKDKNGGWWIVDLKTTARWDDKLLSRLPKDYQLNLYTHFRDRLASIFDLDIDKFKGCRYRATTKSKAKPKANESHEAYVQRIRKAVSSYDVVIPVQSMSPEEIFSLHEANYNRAKELFNGATPSKNLSYCENYYKPCEYFSQCHGCTSTDAKDKVEIKTAEIYKRELKHLEDL